MPYVSPADAINAAVVNLTKLVTDGPIAWSRVAVTASPLLRSVVLSWPGGYQSVPHHHPHAEELFLVLGGEVEMRLGEGPFFRVAVGHLARAQPGEWHTFRVGEAAGATLLAVLAPNVASDHETVERAGEPR